MPIEEFLNLISGWLVIYGVAFMAANTDGPFAIFSSIREKVQSTTTKDWIRNGIECQVCVSFWLGLPVSFALNGGIVMWLSAVGFTCVVVSLSPPSGSED